MALLGDILAAARDRASDVEPLINIVDPSLAAGLKKTAAAEGLSASTFARAAVADFSRYASEQDWATLISSMRDTDDPGTACLVGMVHWRLTVKGCSEHSHAQGAAENCDD
jgi:hypothetical protein